MFNENSNLFNFFSELQNLEQPIKLFSYFVQEDNKAIKQNVQERVCLFCQKNIQTIMEDNQQEHYEKQNSVFYKNFQNDMSLINHFIITHEDEYNFNFKLNANKYQIIIEAASIEQQKTQFIQETNKFSIFEKIPTKMSKKLDPKIDYFMSLVKIQPNINRSQINYELYKQRTKNIKISETFDDFFQVNAQNKIFSSIDDEAYKKSMAKRRLYHSKYFNPVQEDELSDESEYDDNDNVFIKHLENLELENKEELFPLDQEFHKLWNSFIQQKEELQKTSSYKTELNLKKMPYLLQEFIQANKIQLKERLYNNFNMFLCTLLQQGIIDQNSFFTQIVNVKN